MVLITIVTGAFVNQLITGGPHILDPSEFALKWILRSKNGHIFRFAPTAVMFQHADSGESTKGFKRSIRWSKIGGTPSYHPFIDGIFHEINHPAFLGTHIYGNPHFHLRSISWGRSHVTPFASQKHPWPWGTSFGLVAESHQLFTHGITYMQCNLYCVPCGHHIFCTVCVTHIYIYIFILYM